MMKSQLIAAIALTSGFGLFTATSAQAQVSEYMHVPAVGINEVTVHGGYGLGTVRFSGAGNADQDYNGLRNLGATWSYGYSDWLSLGADVSFTSIETGPVDSSGIEPIKLFAAGKNAMGPGTLQYGVRAQFAIEQADIEGNGDSNRTYGDALSNFGEGGFELAPWVGYSFAAGPGLAGARLSYEIMNTDTDVEGGTELSGGSEGNLAVFYEYNLADMPLGAALTYDWMTSVDTESAGGTTELIDDRAFFGVNLYTRLMTSSGGFGFIPSLVWREQVSGETLDKASDVRLAIAGRFSF